MTEIFPAREVWHPSTEGDRKAILQELREILGSPQFCNSRRYPALLRFCVENTLAGHTERLKERNLGVEVFERRPDYDTSADTVVRYTAGEVRKRLQLYYHEQGRGSRIRISLPSGSYVPDFSYVLDECQNGDSTGTPSSPQPASPSILPSLLHQSPPPVEKGYGAEPFRSAAGSTEPVPRALGKTSPKIRPVRFLVWSTLVLGLTLAAGGWIWFQSAHRSAVDRFWAPLLHGSEPILLCSGGSVFAPNHFSGVATAGRNTDYPFVSMQSASAIGHLSGLLERSGASYEIRASASTSLPEMRGHPVILLGGYNNDWTLRLLAPLRFRFSPGPENSIKDRDHPEVYWARDRSRAYSDADDFAIIARFRDTNTDSMVIVLAGLGRNGTEGAAQFVTDPHYMEQLRDRMGSNFSSKNVEVVIRSSVIEGKTGAPSIQSVYVW